MEKAIYFCFRKEGAAESVAPTADSNGALYVAKRHLIARFAERDCPDHDVKPVRWYRQRKKVVKK